METDTILGAKNDWRVFITSIVGFAYSVLYKMCVWIKVSINECLLINDGYTTGLRRCLHNRFISLGKLVYEFGSFHAFKCFYRSIAIITHCVLHVLYTVLFLSMWFGEKYKNVLFATVHTYHSLKRKNKSCLSVFCFLFQHQQYLSPSVRKDWSWDVYTEWTNTSIIPSYKSYFTLQQQNTYCMAGCVLA